MAVKDIIKIPDSLIISQNKTNDKKSFAILKTNDNLQHVINKEHGDLLDLTNSIFSCKYKKNL